MQIDTYYINAPNVNVIFKWLPILCHQYHQYLLPSSRVPLNRIPSYSANLIKFEKFDWRHNLNASKLMKLEHKFRIRRFSL